MTVDDLEAELSAMLGFAKVYTRDSLADMDEWPDGQYFTLYPMTVYRIDDPNQEEIFTALDKEQACEYEKQGCEVTPETIIVME